MRNEEQSQGLVTPAPSTGAKGFEGGVAAHSAEVPPGQPGELQAPSAAMPHDENFAYEGGPIIASPEVHVSFWGPDWAHPDHATERANLVQFTKDLLDSDYMNILSQYGAGKGAGKCGSWMGECDLPSAKGRMSDRAIHRAIQSLIDSGQLPEPSSPSNMALMIFLDESIKIDDRHLEVVMCERKGDTAFGYHNHFTTKAGHQLYYSVIPALDDKCLQESCPEDNSCSLHLAATQEQRRTQVASHEFAEMVSDPEINAWRDSQSGAENGDICNGRNGSIKVKGRVWTVQQMYSLVDDQAGRPACVLGPAQPIPPLPR